MNLSADEREICVCQTDEERAEGVWHVYTSSPFWMRRLDKFGELVQDRGEGKEYRLQQNQVHLRKLPKKRVMTEEQREAVRERLQKSRGT
jgi:hypothetical protein